MCFATTYPKLALNINKYFSIPILKYYTNFNMYAYSISVTDKLDHIMLYQVHLARVGLKLMLVVIDNDCTGSCKSNHMITTTMAPIGVKVNWFEIVTLYVF
jgi:hypothetical protein